MILHDSLQKTLIHWIFLLNFVILLWKHQSRLDQLISIALSRTPPFWRQHLLPDKPRKTAHNLTCIQWHHLPRRHYLDYIIFILLTSCQAPYTHHSMKSRHVYCQSWAFSFPQHRHVLARDYLRDLNSKDWPDIGHPWCNGRDIRKIGATAPDCGEAGQTLFWAKRVWFMPNAFGWNSVWRVYTRAKRVWYA